MILKSMSRQAPSYGNLLTYMTRDKAELKDKQGKPLLIKHNITGRTLKDLDQAFLENEKNRANNRKGSVKVFHDILSWHYSDRQNIDASKIEAIAREYIRLRNDKGMYVGSIHQDKEHTHLHFCISGTETFTGRGMRVSKQRFQEIKEQLQAFEKERFPELIHSVVDFEKKSKYRKTEPEHQLEKRGKVSVKETTKTLLEKIYKDSVSKEDFFSKLIENGLTMYERGGKVAGINSGERHMRFTTLGYDELKFTELDSRQDRIKELTDLRGKEAEMQERELSEEKDAEDRIQGLGR